MKKTVRNLLLIVLAVLMPLTAVSCKKDRSIPDGMKKASGDEADFVMYVPEKWTVDMATAAVSAYADSKDPSSVSMMGWDLEHTDYSLNEWWETNESENRKVFSNYESVSTENLTIDGIYAEKKVYKASLGDYDYEILQAACVKNATVYLFTYTSTPDKYESHISEVEQIINNLKIGK